MVLVYYLGHDEYWKCSLPLQGLCGKKNAKNFTKNFDCDPGSEATSHMLFNM